MRVFLQHRKMSLAVVYMCVCLPLDSLTNCICWRKVTIDYTVMDKSPCRPREEGGELWLLLWHIMIVFDVIGGHAKNHRRIIRIGRDPMIQIWVERVDTFPLKFWLSICLSCLCWRYVPNILSQYHMSFVCYLLTSHPKPLLFSSLSYIVLFVDRRCEIYPPIALRKCLEWSVLKRISKDITGW